MSGAPKMDETDGDDSPSQKTDPHQANVTVRAKLELAKPKLDPDEVVVATFATNGLDLNVSIQHFKARSRCFLLSQFVNTVVLYFVLS